MTREELIEKVAKAISETRSSVEWHEYTEQARSWYRDEATAAIALITEACAGIAETGCLVPPDGGSPTESEVELCNHIATAIRGLGKTTD